MTEVLQQRESEFNIPPVSSNGHTYKKAFVSKQCKKSTTLDESV